MARVALVFLLGLAGCVNTRLYGCHSKLALPTMTDGQISIGAEAHVRAVSEGASGRLGNVENRGFD